MHNVSFYYNNGPPERRPLYTGNDRKSQLRHIFMTIKRLENLLNPNEDGDLGEIIRHAQDMGELVQILQRSLPEDAAASVRAANIRDDEELVVLAASPAWAAKLRFEAERLIAAVRESGTDVKSCTVRVSRD